MVNTFILSLCLLMGCNLQQSEQVMKKKFDAGEWISVEDKNYMLDINQSNIIEYYESELVDSYEYKIEDKSCNDDYYSKKRSDALFLIKYLEDEKYCYEIIKNTDSEITLIWTENGKQMKFKRKNDNKSL